MKAILFNKLAQLKEATERMVLASPSGSGGFNRHFQSLHRPRARTVQEDELIRRLSSCDKPMMAEVAPDHRVSFGRSSSHGKPPPAEKCPFPGRVLRYFAAGGDSSSSRATFSI